MLQNFLRPASPLPTHSYATDHCPSITAVSTTSKISSIVSASSASIVTTSTDTCPVPQLLPSIYSTEDTTTRIEMELALHCHLVSDGTSDELPTSASNYDPDAYSIPGQNLHVIEMSTHQHIPFGEIHERGIGAIISPEHISWLLQRFADNSDASQSTLHAFALSHGLTPQQFHDLFEQYCSTEIGKRAVTNALETHRPDSPAFASSLINLWKYEGSVNQPIDLDDDNDNNQADASSPLHTSHFIRGTRTSYSKVIVLDDDDDDVIEVAAPTPLAEKSSLPVETYDDQTTTLLSLESLESISPEIMDHLTAFSASRTNTETLADDHMNTLDDISTSCQDYRATADSVESSEGHTHTEINVSAAQEASAMAQVGSSGDNFDCISENTQWNAFAKHMNSQKTTLSRLATIHVLLNVSDKKILYAFMSSKGIQVLSMWLNECILESDNNGLLVNGILQLITRLPFSLESLKHSGIGRTVKRFQKYATECSLVNESSSMAKALVDRWTAWINDSLQAIGPPTVEKDVGRSIDVPTTATRAHTLQTVVQPTFNPTTQPQLGEYMHGYFIPEASKTVYQEPGVILPSALLVPSTLSDTNCTPMDLDLSFLDAPEGSFADPIFPTLGPSLLGSKESNDLKRRASDTSVETTPPAKVLHTNFEPSVDTRIPPLFEPIIKASNVAEYELDALETVSISSDSEDFSDSDVDMDISNGSSDSESEHCDSNVCEATIAVATPHVVAVATTAVPTATTVVATVAQDEKMDTFSAVVSDPVALTSVTSLFKPNLQSKAPLDAFLNENPSPMNVATRPTVETRPVIPTPTVRSVPLVPVIPTPTVRSVPLVPGSRIASFAHPLSLMEKKVTSTVPLLRKPYPVSILSKPKAGLSSQLHPTSNVISSAVTKPKKKARFSEKKEDLCKYRIFDLHDIIRPRTKDPQSSDFNHPNSSKTPHTHEHRRQSYSCWTEPRAISSRAHVTRGQKSAEAGVQQKREKYALSVVHYRSEDIPPSPAEPEYTSTAAESLKVGFNDSKTVNIPRVMGNFQSSVSPAVSGTTNPGSQLATSASHAYMNHGASQHSYSYSRTVAPNTCAHDPRPSSSTTASYPPSVYRPELNAYQAHLLDSAQDYQSPLAQDHAFLTSQASTHVAMNTPTPSVSSLPKSAVGVRKYAIGHVKLVTPGNSVDPKSLPDGTSLINQTKHGAALPPWRPFSDENAHSSSGTRSAPVDTPPTLINSRPYLNQHNRNM
ncbi:hypothetical protein BASA61_005951 [Batrachochytrium salamandrivorans]|nr:hypothetical protein BASA61_005951 [Batrachochytrium salamandrivorans]